MYQRTSPGSPLPGALQAKMERSFRADFSDVRVHEGAHVRDLGATAYAQGRDLHFAPGRFDPATPGGQALIGHELAHVVQQAEGRVAPTIQGKDLALNDDPSLEREADEMGERAARGELARPGGAVAARAGEVVQGHFVDKRGVVLSKQRDRRPLKEMFSSNCTDANIVGDFESICDDTKQHVALAGWLGERKLGHLYDALRSVEDEAPRRAEDAPPGAPAKKEPPAKKAAPSKAQAPAKEGEKEDNADKLLDYLAESDKEQSKDMADRPKLDELVPTDAPRSSRNRRPPVDESKLKGKVESQIRQARKSPAPDTDTELEELSRLAYLIEAVSSGATCVAVLKNGSTLYVSANTTGKAMAENTAHLFGALEQEEYDKRLDSLAPPEGTAFSYGKQKLDVQKKTGEEQKKSRAKSTRSANALVQTQVVSDQVREKKDATAEHLDKAATDAPRKLDKAHDYLETAGIDHVVIRETVQEEKHAEMRLLEGLHAYLEAGNKLKSPIKVGISKICCALCYMGVQLFNALHKDVQVSVQGAHGRTYQKWPVPKFVRDHLDQFGGVIGKGGLTLEELQDPQFALKVENILMNLKLDDKRGKATGGVVGTGYLSSGETPDSKTETGNNNNNNNNNQSRKKVKAARGRSKPDVLDADETEDTTTAAGPAKRGRPAKMAQAPARKKAKPEVLESQEEPDDEMAESESESDSDSDS